MRLVGRKTRAKKAHSCERCALLREIIAQLGFRASLPARQNGMLRRRVATEMIISCCACELVRTTQSLGDDTHAVAMGPKWTREHGLQSDVWSQVSVGGKSGPSIGARTRARAE